MSELEIEYEGRVAFEVFVPEPGPDGELVPIEEYPQVGTHGLVALSSTGEVVEFIESHNFDKDEVVAVVERLLASEASR